MVQCYCRENGVCAYTAYSSFALIKLFRFDDVLLAANEQWCALVKRLRRDIQNSLSSVGRTTTRLFDDHCKGVAFIDEPQFPARFAGIGGIKEHAAVDERPVGVGDERADVPRTVGSAGLLVLLLDVFDVIPHALLPPQGVSFVDAVIRPALRQADVLMREQKLADAGIERETLHSPARRQHQHCATAIKGVPRSDLLVPGLEHIGFCAVSAGERHALEHTKDCADSDVRVDVAGAVEGIET